MFYSVGFFVCNVFLARGHGVVNMCCVICAMLMVEEFSEFVGAQINARHYFFGVW